MTGTIIFRNYSGTEVAVGNLGVDNTIVMAPFRGRATFRGADRLTTYIFAFDATGDNVSDNEIAVNLEGTRRIKVSVGDLGILGLIGREPADS